MILDEDWWKDRKNFSSHLFLFEGNKWFIWEGPGAAVVRNFKRGAHSYRAVKFLLEQSNPSMVSRLFAQSWSNLLQEKLLRCGGHRKSYWFQICMGLNNSSNEKFVKEIQILLSYSTSIRKETTFKILPWWVRIKSPMW